MEYGAGISIQNNMNCTDVSEAYSNYKEPLCNQVANGFVELLALRVISLPLEIGLCLLGIRVVIRNKIDVPRVEKEKPTSSKKDKKKKKKDKKDKNKADGTQDMDD